MNALTELIQSLEAQSRRTLLFGLAGLLVLVAVLVWVVLPAYEYKSELQRRQAETRRLLGTLAELKSEYQQAKRSAQGRGTGSRQPNDFSLFSFVENQAGRDGIKEHIAYMRPSTEESPQGLVERQVQIRLEKIRLAPLIDFLKHIEYAEARIHVKRLTVRSPRNNPGELRVDLLLAAFE